MPWTCGCKGVCSLQSFSRLAALLTECSHFNGAVSALEEMLEKTPPGDASRSDAQQRLTAAKAAIGRKRVIDHYKILGLERKCPQDEVCWSFCLSWMPNE